MVTQQGSGPMITTTVQPAKLPKFGGGRGESLETFLALMKLRFSEYGAKTPEEKMRLVLGGLRGEAATWFATYIEIWADERFIKKDSDRIGCKVITILKTTTTTDNMTNGTFTSNAR
jgi:hypothetical protein